MASPRSRRRVLLPNSTLEDRVRCALCGRRFGAIGPTHLVRVHGFAPEHPVEEYKALYRPPHTRSAPATAKLLESVAARFAREGRTWTLDRIRDEIRLRREDGKSLQGHRVRLEDPALEDAARGFCGSWAAALEACGLDYSTIRAYRRWSSADLIRALRSRKESGASMRERSVLREQPALRSAARRRFGSWIRTMHEIGLSTG